MNIRTDRVRTMCRWLALAAMLVIGLGVASCTGATPQRGWSGGTLVGDTLYFGSRDGRLVGVNISEGSRTWAVALETGTATTGLGCSKAPIVVSIYGTPVVSDNVIYVGGYNGRAYAFAIDKEKPRKFPSEDKAAIGGSIVGGLVVAQGKVIFGASDGIVYALPAAGNFEAWAEEWKPSWTFHTGGKIWSAPALDDGTVYVGSYDRRLYAINASDGSLKWEYPPQGTPTEGAFVATPVVYGGTVYAGSFDRHLYAVDAVTGRLKWKFEAGHAFWARPVVAKGLIYAASLDGSVYVLNPLDGQKVAEVKLKSPVSSSPIVVGDSVVVASEAGVIWAIDTATNQGRELANLGEKVYAELTANDTRVFVHTDRDSVFGVDVANGTLRPYVFK